MQQKPFVVHKRKLNTIELIVRAFILISLLLFVSIIVIVLFGKSSKEKQSPKTAESLLTKEEILSDISFSRLASTITINSSHQVLFSDDITISTAANSKPYYFGRPIPGIGNMKRNGTPDMGYSQLEVSQLIDGTSRPFPAQIFRSEDDQFAVIFGDSPLAAGVSKFNAKYVVEKVIQSQGNENTFVWDSVGEIVPFEIQELKVSMIFPEGMKDNSLRLFSKIASSTTDFDRVLSEFTSKGMDQDLELLPPVSEPSTGKTLWSLRSQSALPPGSRALIKAVWIE